MASPIPHPFPLRNALQFRRGKGRRGLGEVLVCHVAFLSFALGGINRMVEIMRALAAA